MDEADSLSVYPAHTHTLAHPAAEAAERIVGMRREGDMRWYSNQGGHKIRPERVRGDPRSGDEGNKEEDISGNYTVGHKSFNKSTRSLWIIDKLPNNVWKRVQAQRWCLSFYYTISHHTLRLLCLERSHSMMCILSSLPLPYSCIPVDLPFPYLSHSLVPPPGCGLIRECVAQNRQSITVPNLSAHTHTQSLRNCACLSLVIFCYLQSAVL